MLRFVLRLFGKCYALHLRARGVARHPVSTLPETFRYDTNYPFF